VVAPTHTVLPTKVVGSTSSSAVQEHPTKEEEEW